MIHFDESLCRQLSVVRQKEWLLTNGIGGYASSTVAGMNTRRYHGLLIAATQPPQGRVVLLSQLEDVIIVDGVRFELSTNLYLGDVVHPAGYLNLSGFRLDPFPVFTYARDGWKIEKSVFMVAGENTTVIEYAFSSESRDREAFLEVRPLIAFRDYHGITHENDTLDRSIVQTAGCVEIQPYSGLPRLYLAHDPADVRVDGYWYKDFEYEQERTRGLDYVEDLFSPLALKADLKTNARFSVIASTTRKEAAAAATHKRAEFQRASLEHFRNRTQFGGSDLVPTLYRAAEQFIVNRAPFKTILAGYHWFGDWGRDAMIALPGLLLGTDRPEIAREILLQYVRYIDKGMLPNRFPEAGEAPEYNTVDATLWFFEAIRQYYHHRKDDKWRESALHLLRESLYAPLKSIVAAHLSGTRFGIHADDEGFLWAGDPGTQLTWMDARVGDTAITPRSGKAVEIQALWYNALRTLQEFGKLLGDDLTSESASKLANKLQANFEPCFWNEETGYLKDVVHDSGYDGSLRPNQIFAISLHYNLLRGTRARSVLKAVEDELLTPVGLRTLSSKDSQYRGRYEGGVWGRDSAYHQGTVWPWLAGPFFFAKLGLSETVEETLREIEAWLRGLSEHLLDAGLGQISEIFDGDAPHEPKGCIAQAWSVAEILRLAKLVSTHPARRHA